MVMELPKPSGIEKKSWLGYAAALVLHTYIAYTCAMHLSAWLVFHWFGWALPILHVYTTIPAADWYLQHFELMTILPALVVGFLNIARFLPPGIRHFMHEGSTSIALCAWALPALVLLYRMLEYHAPSSVLYGNSMSAVRYFFDIQKVMPTWRSPLASDPVRVWAQMSVTAPLYAGVAYSLGAVLSKYGVVTKLLTFEKHDESTTQQDSLASQELERPSTDSV
jgi:hypothetical protein